MYPTCENDLNLVRAVFTAIIIALSLASWFLVSRLVLKPVELARQQLTKLTVDDVQSIEVDLAVSAEVDEIFHLISLLRVNLQEKIALIREERYEARRLQELAERDPLTNLLNRRALEEAATRRIQNATINGHELAVMIVDIDHFKSVNDTFGHQAGDEVIKGVATQLSQTLRGSDLIGRLGGEEFVVLFDHKGSKHASKLAERVRVSIEASSGTREPPIAVTVSIGVTTRPADSGIGWHDLLSIADKRLYRAKRQGRNRVCWDDILA